METFSLVKTKRNQFHPTLGTPAAKGGHISRPWPPCIGQGRRRRLPPALPRHRHYLHRLDFRWPLDLGCGSGPSNVEVGWRDCPRRGTSCCGCSRRQAFLRFLPIYTDSRPFSVGPPTQHSMGLDGAGYMGRQESGQRWKVIIGSFL